MKAGDQQRMEEKQTVLQLPSVGGTVCRKMRCRFSNKSCQVVSQLAVLQSFPFALASTCRKFEFNFILRRLEYSPVCIFPLGGEQSTEEFWCSLLHTLPGCPFCCFEGTLG